MTDSLKMQCKLLTENQIILKKHFPLEGTYMLQLASCIYASEKSLADPIKIKHALSLIKSKTKAFSHFRASIRIVLAAIISLDPEPEKLLDRIILKHSELKAHFRRSTYLPYAAYISAKYKEADPSVIKEYFTSLKPVRPVFGLENDVVFATLYSLFGKSSKYIISDIDFFTQELSETFHKHSSKIAARILAFGQGRGYSERLRELKLKLDESNIKFGKGVEITALAPFALLDLPVDGIEEMIWEFLDHFEKSSNSSKLFIGKQKFTYAAWLTFCELIKKSENSSYIFAKEAAFAVIIANAINMTAAQHSAAL